MESSPPSGAISKMLKVDDGSDHVNNCMSHCEVEFIRKVEYRGQSKVKIMPEARDFKTLYVLCSLNLNKRNQTKLKSLT